MLQEQLFNALPDQTKKYVWDRQVRTADETALEADRWFQGTKLTENFHKPENKVSKPQVSGAFTPRNQGGYRPNGNGGGAGFPPQGKTAATAVAQGARTVRINRNLSLIAGLAIHLITRARIARNVIS